MMGSSGKAITRGALYPVRAFPLLLSRGCQFLLLFVRQTLDGELTLQGGGAVGDFFEVNELHRAAQAGVTRAGTVVMLLEAARGVGGPAGVVGVVRAVEYVDEEAHGLMILFFRINVFITWNGFQVASLSNPPEGQTPPPTPPLWGGELIPKKGNSVAALLRSPFSGSGQDKWIGEVSYSKSSAD